MITLLYYHSAVTTSSTTTTTTTTSSWNEIRINFTNTSQSISTYNSLNPPTNGFSNLFGATGGAVYTSGDLLDTTGVSTGVTISTVNMGNWGAYNDSGTYRNKLNVSAITGGNYLAGATEAVYETFWFNYATVQPARYDAAKPQLRLAGLPPLTNFTLKLAGADGNLGFTSKWVTRAVGNNSSSVVEVNGDVTNITTGATLTVQSSSTGTIDIWVNTSTTNSGELATIAGMTISK